MVNTNKDWAVELLKLGWTEKRLEQNRQLSRDKGIPEQEWFHLCRTGLLDIKEAEYPQWYATMDVRDDSTDPIESKVRLSRKFRDRPAMSRLVGAIFSR